MVKNIITKQRKPNLIKQTSHRPQKIGPGFELKKEALRETAGT